METVIRIKKNKPAFKALILLAKELEKNDQQSISVTELEQGNKQFDLIQPVNNDLDIFALFDQLSGFPTIEELRDKAWRKVS